MRRSLGVPLSFLFVPPLFMLPAVSRQCSGYAFAISVVAGARGEATPQAAVIVRQIPPPGWGYIVTDGMLCH
jgi:hypothetical protein